MMSSRNALTQLLGEVIDGNYDLESAVRYLESNGVIVMSFKIGDTVYWYDKKLMNEPMAVRVTDYRSDHHGRTKWICSFLTEFVVSDVGKTIFLTKEDVEKAVLEGRNNERTE